MNATLVYPTPSMKTLLNVSQLTELANKWLADYPTCEQCEECGEHDNLRAIQLINGKFLCWDCAQKA